MRDRALIDEVTLVEAAQAIIDATGSGDSGRSGAPEPLPAIDL